jgi:[ribosomal protein S18]-alanine N-acetyltransferase
MHGLVRVAPIVPAEVAIVAELDPVSQRGEQDLQAELALPWSRVWVAHEAGIGVVGFVVFWHVVDEIHVIHLGTRLDQRRRGLGRTVLGAVVDYARAHHVRHVLLEVRRSNDAAIGLYRAAGFRAVGARTGYYRDGEDAIEMTLTLAMESADGGRPSPE